jgi:hypothetical protein
MSQNIFPEIALRHSTSAKDRHHIQFPHRIPGIIFSIGIFGSDIYRRRKNVRGQSSCPRKNIWMVGGWLLHSDRCELACGTKLVFQRGLAEYFCNMADYAMVAVSS